MKRLIKAAFGQMAEDYQNFHNKYGRHIVYFTVAVLLWAASMWLLTLPFLTPDGDLAKSVWIFLMWVVATVVEIIFIFWFHGALESARERIQEENDAMMTALGDKSPKEKADRYRR
jgi:hypothetical protein